MHWGRTPPTVNRMTERCKNITFDNFVADGNEVKREIYSVKFTDQIYMVNLISKFT